MIAIICSNCYFYENFSRTILSIFSNTLICRLFFSDLIDILLTSVFQLII